MSKEYLGDCGGSAPAGSRLTEGTVSMEAPAELPDPVVGAAGAARPNGSSATPSVISIVELGEALASRGRERGFLTSQDLLEDLPAGDLTPEQVEELLTRITEHLRNEGIEVLDLAVVELEIQLPRGTVPDQISSGRFAARPAGPGCPLFSRLLARLTDPHDHAEACS